MKAVSKYTSNRIYQFVILNPGINTSQLAKAMKVGRGALYIKLRKMENNNELINVPSMRKCINDKHTDLMVNSWFMPDYIDDLPKPKVIL